MKYLRFLLGFCFFTDVLSTLIYDNNDICEVERLYLIRQHDECVPDEYSLVNIFEQFQKIAEQQLSQYVMKEYVTNFCAKTDNATACYNLISVTDRCQNSAAVLNEINTLKFVEVVLNYMCEDVGSRFNDLLSDDGPQCYATNDEHTECMGNEMTKLNLDSETFGNVFIEPNTCRFIQAAKYCLYTYDSCLNKKVKDHMTKLNRVLNIAYDC